MDNKVDITHKEWTDTQSKLSTIEKDIESIKEQLEVNSNDIEDLEKSVFAYRLALNETIKEEVKPILEQIKQLNDENKKLSERIIKSENAKFKIVATAAGSLVMVILTYLVTLFLNNLLVK